MGDLLEMIVVVTLLTVVFLVNLLGFVLATSFVFRYFDRFDEWRIGRKQRDSQPHEEED